MRLVKVLGALVALLAFGAIAATGASAHFFEASKSPLLLLAKQSGLQIFTTAAGTVTCETLKGHGIATGVQVLTQIVTVAYTGCNAKVGAVTGTVTEPILAEYSFNADNEQVTILQPVLIKATLAGIKCEVGVSAQGPLTLVAYDNQAGGKILLLSNVTGITTSAKGAGCKEQYTSSKTGTYTGNATTEADGGEIKWV